VASSFFLQDYERVENLPPHFKVNQVVGEPGFCSEEQPNVVADVMNFNVISNPLQITESVEACVANLEKLFGKSISATDIACFITSIINGSLDSNTIVDYNGNILATAIKQLVKF
jgi:tetrahydromethanopterin S-methyltransferase subunit G